MSLNTSYEDLNIRLVSVCENIVRAVVKEPNLVTVTFDHSKEALTISVSPKDRGIVIGRGGQNLRALEETLTLGARYLLRQSKNVSTAQLASYTLPSLEISVSHQEQDRIPR